jgi:phosphatidylglycerophosphate synthase
MDTGRNVVADFLFLLAISTDLVDGYIARKLGASSKLGANFDACIDFLFIGGAFLYFTYQGFYPAWVLLIITAMFLQFIITGNLTKVVFDPVGKYYGSLLFGAIGLTMLFQEQNAREIITLAIVGVSIASLTSRLFYYTKK